MEIHRAPRTADQTIDDLFIDPPTDDGELAERLRSMAATLPPLLMTFPSKDRSTLLEVFDARRRAMKVRAAEAYRDALKYPALAADDATREVMLTALLDEPGDDTVALLRALRQGATKRLRAPFQSALVRAEASREGATAQANDVVVELHAANADGQGGIALFVGIPSVGDTVTSVMLCVRINGDARTGLAESRISRREFASIRHDFVATSGMTTTPAPAAEALRWIDAAIRRTTPKRLREEPGLSRAIELLKRLPRAEAPAVVPGVGVSAGRLRELMDRDYMRPWYFDRTDLAAAKVSSPPRFFDSVTLHAWINVALGKLAETEFPQRLLAMTRYMSEWSRWRVDLTEAAEWTTLAEGVERDFTLSPLAFLMLAQTIAGRDKPLGTVRSGAPNGMVPFSSLFPQVAERDLRVLRFTDSIGIPAGEYGVEEGYCIDPECDCRRVLLSIRSAGGRTVAVIGHALDFAVAKRHGLPRTYLDPMHPQERYAIGVCDGVSRLLSEDRGWERLLWSHYARVKESIGAPTAKPNDPCPCGSGKKYQSCCRP